MPKLLRCGDIFPGCISVFRGETSDEVIIDLAQHARSAHDLREFTPEILRRLRSSVRFEKATAA